MVDSVEEADLAAAAAVAEVEAVLGVVLAEAVTVEARKSLS